MIIALFKFILIAALVVFVMVCLTAFSIFRSFHNISKRYKDAWRGGNGASMNGGRRQNADEDEVIIDKRTPNEANRKIFAEGEGEYVDFEEDK